MKPVGPEQIQDTQEHDYISLYISNLKKYKQMKPVGPEQIQDTQEHDYISLCVGELKKHKQMKQAMTEIIIEIHKIMMINGTW